MILNNINNLMVGSTQASKVYLGSTTIWEKNSSELPAGYTQLEYIESTGTQYIDTGIIPTQGTSVEIDFQYINLLADTALFGIWEDPWNALLYHCTLYNDKWYFGSYDTDDGNIDWINGSPDNQRYTVKIDGLGNLYQNNVLLKQNSELTTYETTLPIYIFARNNGNSASNLASIRCFGARIYSNEGVLLRDYIPCLNINNIAGLFDLITKTFYSSQGEDNFLYGLKISLPAGYTQVEYIASTATGGQYIDLNLQWFTDVNSIGLNAKFNMIGSGADNHDQATLIGAMYESSPYPGYVIRKDGNQYAQTGMYLGSYGGKFATIGQDFTFTGSKSNISVSHNQTTTLFCGLKSNNTPQRYSEAKIYYMMIYKNDILVRDLIPCINSESVAGLYDLVNSVFYSSQGDEEFDYYPRSTYVEDGLIFHLDGINKGSVEGKWTDLANGIEFTPYNSPILEDNCYDLSSGHFEGDAGTLFNSTENIYTVEVCFESSKNSFYIFGGGNRGSSHPFFFSSNKTICWGQDLKTYIYPDDFNGAYTMSFNEDRAIGNGTLLESSGSDYWDARDNTIIMIAFAANGGAKDNPFEGKLYSIRVYNRRLTEEEQRHNQAIDNERFNLGLTL